MKEHGRENNSFQSLSLKGVPISDNTLIFMFLCLYTTK